MDETTKEILKKTMAILWKDNIVFAISVILYSAGFIIGVVYEDNFLIYGAFTVIAFQAAVTIFIMSMGQMINKEARELIDNYQEHVESYEDRVKDYQENAILYQEIIKTLKENRE